MTTLVGINGFGRVQAARVRPRLAPWTTTTWRSPRSTRRELPGLVALDAGRTTATAPPCPVTEGPHRDRCRGAAVRASGSPPASSHCPPRRPRAGAPGRPGAARPGHGRGGTAFTSALAR